MTNGSWLVMSRGPQPGQTFILDQDQLTIGRDPRNDIEISEPQVSRQHARITRQGQRMVIEDLGSTNGTFVNGMRLTSPHVLANSDVIGLGDTVTLTYYGEVVAGDSTETIVGRTGMAGEEAEPGSQPFGSRPTPPPPPRESPPPSTPPSSLSPSPPPPPPAPTEEGDSGPNWFLIGCIGLAILACLTLAAVGWYLDANYPQILYAPLRWLGF